MRRTTASSSSSWWFTLTTRIAINISIVSFCLFVSDGFSLPLIRHRRTAIWAAVNASRNEQRRVEPTILSSSSEQPPTELLVSTKRFVPALSARQLNRRNIVHQTAILAAVWFTPQTAAIAAVTSSSSEEQGIPVIKTASGLKYIDLVTGTGVAPDYGNLVSISYTAYVKLPTNARGYSTEPQSFDTVNRYLLKHGNGRTIAGLDEGLHTMRVGGTRRLLIPPKLGFVDVGLGPLPVSPWNRYQLNQSLDRMVELSGGTVIYEVTLLNVIADEADQGYYTDASLTPDDFATLRENLRLKGNEGRIQQRAAEAADANASTGQDRVR